MLPDLILFTQDDRLRELSLRCMSVSRQPGVLAALTQLRDDELSRLLTFAERNLIAPIVSKAILDSGAGSAQTKATAEATYGASATRMIVMLSELDRVASALAEKGIRVVGLKNAGIARGVFPDPALCPMGDVDVLVRKSDFVRAHEVVESCGFQIATRSTVEEASLEAGLEGGGTEYRRQVDGQEVWFELQWRAVAGRWIRADQEPDTDDLIASSVPIEGTDLRLLSPTENMLQVCLHTAKHSYVRAPGLRLHTDVDRLAAFTPPDWDLFVRRATEMSVTHSVFFSLALAKVLLSSDVPDSVLEALAPSKAKRELMWRWFARVDVFEPDDQKFGRPEMMAYHAMLYDDAVGLLSSALGTTPAEVSVRKAPALAKSGIARLRDISTRYQR